MSLAPRGVVVPAMVKDFCSCRKVFLMSSGAPAQSNGAPHIALHTRTVALNTLQCPHTERRTSQHGSADFPCPDNHPCLTACPGLLMNSPWHRAQSKTSLQLRLACRFC